MVIIVDDVVVDNVNVANYVVVAVVSSCLSFIFVGKVDIVVCCNTTIIV